MKEITIEKIEISTTATVTLTNSKGDKFTQEVGLSGKIMVPPNFTQADMVVKKGEGKDATFFNSRVNLGIGS